MNMQTLVNDPNRVTPVQTEHAIEKLAIRVHRRRAAYVFGRTDECRSLAPATHHSLREVLEMPR